jgi:hypothetical protein
MRILVDFAQVGGAREPVNWPRRAENKLDPIGPKEGD